MANEFPATTVKVVSITPNADGKVRILIELIADVNRLAEVGGELLQASVQQMRVKEARRSGPGGSET